ncbi:MAG: serine/threonine protein kinase [Oscillatoria sp. SIO1A7]|nr:serine/threonine protein kinase [Oscillatoria sp. SIO1A7]
MLETGSVLNNRYQLQGQIGENPVRQTWLAEDLQDEQLVVIKLLPFGGPMQWDDLKLFEREAKILRELDCSQIPKYRDYFSIEREALWFGLVEDYIPGFSLKQLLEKGQQFNEAKARQIARSLLEILVYLHDRQPPVLHRDLKPSNLLWGEDNSLYLLDFGAVQNRSTAAGGQTFTVVGTYGYTPIEQFGGQAVPASDLYALGATLIHLLTGTAPSDLPQKEMRIQWRDRIHSSSISPRFLQWIERLTEPALEKRFSSAKEALLALTAYKMPDARPIANTGVRLFKSPERLEIQIPSELELSVLRPLGRFLAKLPKVIIQAIANLGKHFIALSPRVQASILGVTFGAAIILPILFPGLSLSLARIGSDLIFAFTLLPFWLLPLLIPQLLILLLVCAMKGKEYYSSTRVFFDKHNFEIERQPFGSNRVYRLGGKTPDIQKVSAVNESVADPYSDPGIIIAYKSRLAVLFGMKKTGFGRYLSEAELIWLQQEIENWLELQ